MLEIEMSDVDFVEMVKRNFRNLSSQECATRVEQLLEMCRAIKNILKQTLLQDPLL
jgi:hypothetical protein